MGRADGLEGWIDAKQLQMLRECPGSLWINSDSSVAGANDQISKTEAASINRSLLLLKPDDFKVERSNPWSEDKPHYCHRRLVAEYLKQQWGDIEIEHIP